MSEQEVCSPGIRDCRCCCHPPKEELIADKVEGHWENTFYSTFNPCLLPRRSWEVGGWHRGQTCEEVGILWNHRFVPTVATHTDKNGLGAGDESANHFSSPIATTPSHDSTKYGTVLAERDRIKYGAKIAMVQLREVLRARSKPSKEYLNGLSDAHSIFNKVVNNQQEEIKGMKLDRRIFLGIVKEESTQPSPTATDEATTCQNCGHGGSK
jgi:hypothetical protein